MRIFCAIKHSRSPHLFYGGLWSGNFYPALLDLGHEIVESQVDLLQTSQFMDIAADFTLEETQARAETTQLILDEVGRAHRERPVDLFLSYFYNAHFDPAGFGELRRLGIPSVNFYCNGIHQFPLVAAIAARAEFSWHPERDAASSYRRVGGRPVHVQMGADPNIYRPKHRLSRRRRACFIGQKYADRETLACHLVKGGVPIDLYGAGWRRDASLSAGTQKDANVVHLGRTRSRPGSLRSYWSSAANDVLSDGLRLGLTRLLQRLARRGAAPFVLGRLRDSALGRADDVAETFSAYELVLNFSNVWADGRPGAPLVPHVRLRDFEAPMSRSCYLTGYTDELSQYYELGKEIDTYRTAEELLDKARFYLRSTAAAESLREAGYRRATREHTWTRRFEQLFSRVGLVA